MTTDTPNTNKDSTVWHMPTEPSFPGELVSSDYPLLAGVLKEYFANDHNGSWSDWVCEFGRSKIIDRPALVAELNGLLSNKTVLELTLRDWVRANSQSDSGLLEMDSTARDSLMTLQKVL